MDVTVVGALIEIKLSKKVLKQCCQSSYIVITVGPQLQSHLSVLLSDHSAIFCGLQFQFILTEATKWWFNSTLLTNTGFASSLRPELQQPVNINRGDCDNPQMWIWETTNCFISVFCISLSTFAKAKNKQLVHLQCKIQSVKTLQKQHFSNEQAAQDI